MLVELMWGWTQHGAKPAATIFPSWNMGIRADPNFFVISKFFGDLLCMQKTWVLHMCEVLLWGPYWDIKEAVIKRNIKLRQ